MRVRLHPHSQPQCARPPRKRPHYKSSHKFTRCTRSGRIFEKKACAICSREGVSCLGGVPLIPVHSRMDVEGFEAKVVGGGRRFFMTANIPFIRDGDLREMLAFFGSLGYHMSTDGFFQGMSKLSSNKDLIDLPKRYEGLEYGWKDLFSRTLASFCTLASHRCTEIVPR